MSLFSWFKPKNKDLTPPPSLVERVNVLESDFALLRHDWEEVLDRLTRRVARDAAAKRNALKATLDAPPPESAPEEALEALPSKAQLWDLARKRRA